MQCLGRHHDSVHVMRTLHVKCNRQNIHLTGKVLFYVEVMVIHSLIQYSTEQMYVVDTVRPYEKWYDIKSVFDSNGHRLTAHLSGFEGDFGLLIQGDFSCYNLFLVALLKARTNFTPCPFESKTLIGTFQYKQSQIVSQIQVGIVSRIQVLETKL